jgi:hypothetical protein
MTMVLGKRLCQQIELCCLIYNHLPTQSLYALERKWEMAGTVYLHRILVKWDAYNILL